MLTITIEDVISKQNLEKLRLAVQKREMAIIPLNSKIVTELNNIEILNHHLNNTLLIYPYVSVNNHKSTTSKRDLVDRKKDKYLNALEIELSIKNILYRIAKGDTLVINKLQKFDENLRLLSRFFSEQFLAKTNVNLYYAYKNTTGINLHFDYDDIFSIQTHGKKYWKIYKKDIGNTSKLIEQHEKPKTNDKADFIDVVTEIGDLLFLPKGFWHYAYTKEESSIHLSLSLKPLKINTLFDYILNTCLNGLGEKPLYNFTKESITAEIEMALSSMETINVDFNEIEELEKLTVPHEYKIELE